MELISNAAHKVRSLTSAASDVTAEFQDTAARIKVLTAAREQLLVLMNRSGTVAEILQVSGEVTRTTEQLEVLLGRVKQITTQVEFSLITLLCHLVSAQPPEQPGWLAHILSSSLSALGIISLFILEVILRVLIFSPLLAFAFFFVYFVAKIIMARFPIIHDSSK